MIEQPGTPPPDVETDEGDGGDGERCTAIRVSHCGDDDVHRECGVILPGGSTAEQQAEHLLAAVRALAVHIGGELPAAIARRLAP